MKRILDRCRIALGRIGSVAKGFGVWLIGFLRPTRGKLLLFVACAVAAAAFLLDAPNTMLSASVHTEVVELQVVNTAASTFALSRGRLESSNACHESIVVKPEVGALVTYARPGKGTLTVSVYGPAVWYDAARRQNGQVFQSADNLAFELRDREKEGVIPCPPEGRVRLPVQGVVTFGSDLAEIRDATTQQVALLSGKLTLYGRAMPKLLGVPLDFGPLKADALYFSREIPVPGGSRIATATRHPSDHADTNSDARWFGFADVVFGEGGPGAMTVEASTNARFVELYTPAPFHREAGGGGYRPDIISLSLGARLTGDPNLLWIYGLIAFFIALIQLEGFRHDVAKAEGLAEDISKS